MLRNGEQGDRPQVPVPAHPVGPASSADHRETSLGEWQQPSLLYPMSEGIRDLCSSASCKHGREKNGKKWGGGVTTSSTGSAAGVQGRSH